MRSFPADPEPAASEPAGPEPAAPVGRRSSPAGRRVAAAALAAASILLVSCGGSSSGTNAAAAASGATSAGHGQPAISGTITVFAAASLTETFTTLGKRFEAAHPGTKVTLSFGSSATLAQQITQGAPADVFAAASKKTMQQAVDAGAIRSPKTFATNTMEIAVPPGNPAHVAGLADLGRSGVKVVLCQPQVPCGAAAAAVFAKAKLTVHPASLEADVKATLTKVTLDEADAGVVYVTDVKAAGKKVTGILIPAAQNSSTVYPIGTVGGSRNAATAVAFVNYVLSDEGASVFAAAGFGTP